MAKTFTCPICLEDLEKKNIIILECAHHYHIKCYTEFILHSVKVLVDEYDDITSVKCPLCRKVDTSMFIPVFTEMLDNVDAIVGFNMFRDDIEVEIRGKMQKILKDIIN